MAILQQSLTLDECLKLPEKKPALEFEDGMVTQKVSPKGRHSVLQFAVAEWVNRLARPQHLALAFTELRATFGGASRVPDVSVYRWERIPTDELGQVADDFYEPPDIAVEIISPRQSPNALVRRCLWYVAHGVRAALLVDPADHSVLVFRPAQEPLALRGADRIALEDVVPGLTLSTQELFDALIMR